jgi:N utilization substance protein A
MAEDLLTTVQQMSKERGISPDVFYSAIKEAVLTVASKYFEQISENTQVHVEIDKQKGQIQVYILKKVVNEVKDPVLEISWKEAVAYDPMVSVGDEIKIFMPGETLGRVAAQTAKHLIMNKVFKAEQQNIYSKYISLVGTLISGEIRRVDVDNLIIGLDIGEAIIPAKELSPKDSFKRGELIKFYIKRVFPEGKGPLILGSRYMNNFVGELIRMEVPEVSEGIVKIYSIAREPGFKTKVAVYSVDKTVDPVGAIVGMNGNRVLAITKELKGERIDVIAWSNSPERFIASSLTPAEVVKVKIIDKNSMKAEVTVSDNSLSAAIGRRGINIKLASKLTKWNLQLTNRMPDKNDYDMKKI